MDTFPATLIGILQGLVVIGLWRVAVRCGVLARPGSYLTALLGALALLALVAYVAFVAVGVRADGRLAAAGLGPLGLLVIGVLAAHEFLRRTDRRP